MLPADQDGEGMRSTIELRTLRQSLLLHLLAQNYVWLSGPWQGGLSKGKNDNGHTGCDKNDVSVRLCT
jgi:hypothetical protein